MAYGGGLGWRSAAGWLDCDVDRYAGEHVSANTVFARCWALYFRCGGNVGYGTACYLVASSVWAGYDHWDVDAGGVGSKYCSVGFTVEKPGYDSPALRTIAEGLKVVITNLIGGLGNQMFQYAAGRAISLECGTTLKLDISGFANYKTHQWINLQRIFNCTVEIANETDLRGIIGWQNSPVIRRALLRSGMAVFRRDGYIVEPHFHFWSGIKRVPQDCYLVGYWQSERYFQDVEPVIRADFTFKFPLVNMNAELAEQISQVNAVSLHVRRGDYARDAKTKAMHGLCPPEYYRDAIQYVSGRVEQPHFFIFSDDIAWAKDNLKTSSPCQFVDHNRGAESYNDMRLMSLCRHHIIANSSFSWWGAWLNHDTDKIVVAPKKWFAKESNLKDLYPRGWVTL